MQVALGHAPAKPATKPVGYTAGGVGFEDDVISSVPNVVGAHTVDGFGCPESVGQIRIRRDRRTRSGKGDQPIEDVVRFGFRHTADHPRQLVAVAVIRIRGRAWILPGSGFGEQAVVQIVGITDGVVGRAGDRHACAVAAIVKGVGSCNSREAVVFKIKPPRRIVTVGNGAWCAFHYFHHLSDVAVEVVLVRKLRQYYTALTTIGHGGNQSGAIVGIGGYHAVTQCTGKELVVGVVRIP